jgi:hypothetical protein
MRRIQVREKKNVESGRCKKKIICEAGKMDNSGKEGKAGKEVGRKEREGDGG